MRNSLTRWNTLKTFDDILNYLQGDIICFQGIFHPFTRVGSTEFLPEVKSSRPSLPKQIALPSSYNSFFSFPLNKTGYSGVATYTRTDTVIPLKAEEGLTGLIQPRPAFSEKERISRSGSYPHDVDDPDAEKVNYKDLDGEGRAVVTDFGLFVLINVYCPNDGCGSTERENFKMNYHRLLEARVHGLIQEGRQVIVVGDLNACAAVDDHCEGQLMVARGLREGLQGEEGFWGKEYRRWIRDWLIKDDGTGCLIDIVRKFWPGRKGMYTCAYILVLVYRYVEFLTGWNTKISARATNYGTRIDFILITPGLIPWIKEADIQPDIKGSDHCPIFVHLRDEITNPDGSSTKLRDVLGVWSEGGLANPPEPPRLAAQHWDEHKQRLLSTFFAKKSDCAPSQQQISGVQSFSNIHGIECQLENGHQTPPIVEEEPQITGATKRKIIVANSPKSTKKLKVSSPNQGSSKPKRKPVAGQLTIASYFSQSQPEIASNSAPKSRLAFDGSSSILSPTRKRHSSPQPNIASHSLPTQGVDQEPDHLSSFFLSASEPQLSSPSTLRDKDKGIQAWRSFLALTEIPKCTTHGEPAKEFTVNKAGPNKGKKFFICSR